MKFTRRNFLATTSIALFSGPRVAASVPALAFIVLQDIPANWTRGTIAIVLEYFRINAVALVIVTPNYIGGSKTVGGAEKRPVSEFIGEDLLEVVSIAPSLNLQQRYWHLRAANEFRRAQINAGPDESVPALLSRPVTYFEHPAAPATDLSAFRSAGFRVRIVSPATSAPVAVATMGRDQLSITGGTLIDLFDPDLGATLAALPEHVEFTVLHISLAGGADLDGDAVARAAEMAVAQIVAALRRRDLRPSLARDYFLSGGAQVPRDIALLLDGPDADGHIDAFAMALATRKLPFSRMTSAAIPGDCAEASSSAVALRADCIVVSGAALPSESAATVVVGPEEVNGLGPDVRMHFGLLDGKAVERLDRLTLAESDLVLRIGVQDVVSEPVRARLLRRLEDGQNLGHVRLHDVPGLRDRVMVSDPVIRRYWSLRRRRRSDPVVASRPDAAERARLMDDAALAWSYFERHIYPETGLAAGTVFAAPGGRVNSEITLWDVASQINALMAATDLRLLNRQVAADMIMTAVGSLPTEQLDGGTLPPSNFSAQTLRTTVAGFDSCDAGRLGIALSRAVSRGFVAGADVLATVKDWTLGQAVRTGWHFSNRNGRWQDTSQSHCTDYIVPGYAFLAQQVVPHFSGGDDSAETEIITLYQAAALGAISTEPYALGAIELGMDGPTRLILDALFDAQLGWFEETGLLRCVSEAPINREPWFIYSGLRLDIDGPDAWVIGTITRDNAALSEDLDSASEIISSKAAYLWRAVHPHSYSDRLVDIVRENARIPGYGFSVGVYADTLSPMPNYTDINTNGIILAAISNILGTD